MYYVPASIPPEFRHPYAMRGISPHQRHLSERATLNDDKYNALIEGGRRNGVLTAIEDFLKATTHTYGFLIAREQYGLGIVVHLADQGAIRRFNAWRIEIFKRNTLNVISTRIGKGIFRRTN
jgi:hypothetical protein